MVTPQLTVTNSADDFRRLKSGSSGSLIVAIDDVSANCPQYPDLKSGNNLKFVI